MTITIKPIQEKSEYFRNFIMERFTSSKPIKQYSLLTKNGVGLKCVDGTDKSGVCILVLIGKEPIPVKRIDLEGNWEI